MIGLNHFLQFCLENSTSPHLIKTIFYYNFDVNFSWFRAYNMGEDHFLNFDLRIVLNLNGNLLNKKIFQRIILSDL